MTTPLITVGMAHHSDFNGAYFSLTSLRMHQDMTSDELELVVVDNSPQNAHGQELAKFCAKLRNCKYVPLPNLIGTSAPRNRVFSEASAPIVVCMDCHVLLKPDALISLRGWLEPYSRDMVTGPMLAADGSVYGTHWNDQWREQMWGTWGTVWQCGCAEKDALRFSFILMNGKIQCVTLVLQLPATTCPACGEDLPALSDWKTAGETLRKADYFDIGKRHTAFEIPGMGLGCFAMRKDAWVGFHPDARGFGGEEMWVHAKVRKAGGRVMCAPWFAWSHRTERVGGVPYPLRRMDRVRNYILEFREMEWDLAPIKDHFVGGGFISEQQWESAERYGHEPPELTPVPPEEQTLDTLYAEWVNLDPRGTLIHDLARAASHVTIIGGDGLRWEAFAGAARPDTIVSWSRTRETRHPNPSINDIITRTETSRSAERRVKRWEEHDRLPRGPHEVAETDLLVVIADGASARQIATLTESMMPKVRQCMVVVERERMHTLKKSTIDDRESNAV